MMASQRSDLAFGFAREIASLPKIQEHLGVYMMKLPQKHTMDFVECIPEADTIPFYAEQKARNSTLAEIAQYKTIIIGENKVEYIRQHGEGVIYFDLKDGLYAIQYDHELFKTFRIQYGYLRGERVDCENKEQNVVHIPVEYLTKVSN